jgi:ParB/RepB/Spo0J family partition protein
MKLRDHQGIISKGDTFRVDPRQLQIDPGFNVRDLDAPTARDALDELKASIRAEGVQVPLEIRLVGEALHVVSGHRRHKVVMELIAEGVDIAHIPAIAEPRAVDEADRTARLITLNSGEPLSQMEKAEVVRRLLGYGWDRGKIAQRLGFKSAQTVANFELLLSAPVEVKTAVREGELSASNAVSMVRAGNASEALTTARETAQATGRKRVTARSIAPKPPGKRSAAAIEAANVARLAKVEEVPQVPHNIADVDKALSLLASVIANDYSPARAAAVYIALPLSEVSQIAEWLIEFEDRLKTKLADREEASRAAFVGETVGAV